MGRLLQGVHLSQRSPCACAAWYLPLYAAHTPPPGWGFLRCSASAPCVCLLCVFSHPRFVLGSQDEGTRMVGDAAKNQAAGNPTNTVNDAKRLIGRAFSDPEVQEDMKQLSCKVKTYLDIFYSSY